MAGLVTSVVNASKPLVLVGTKSPWETRLESNVANLIFDRVEDISALGVIALTCKRFSVLVRNYLPRALERDTWDDIILRVVGVTLKTRIVRIPSNISRETLIIKSSILEDECDQSMLCILPHRRNQLEKILQQYAQPSITTHLNLLVFNASHLLYDESGTRCFSVLQHLIRNYQIYSLDGIPALMMDASLKIEMEKDPKVKERLDEEEIGDLSLNHSLPLVRQLALDLTANGQIMLGIILLPEPKFLRNLMLNLCSRQKVYLTEGKLSFFVSDGQIDWKSRLIKKQFLDEIIQLIFGKIPQKYTNIGQPGADGKKILDEACKVLVEDRVKNLSICLGHLVVRDEFVRAKAVLEQIKRECSELFEPIVESLSDYAYTTSVPLFAQCLKFSFSLTPELRKTFLLGLSGVPKGRIQENFLHRNLELLMRMDDPQHCNRALNRLFYSVCLAQYHPPNETFLFPTSILIRWLGSLIEIMQFPEIKCLTDLYVSISKKLDRVPLSSKTLREFHGQPDSLSLFIEKVKESLECIDMAGILTSSWMLTIHEPEEQKVEPGSAKEKAQRFAAEMHEVRSLEEHWKVRAELRKKGIVLPMAPPLDVSHLSDGELIDLYHKTLITHQHTQSFIAKMLHGNVPKAVNP